MAKEIFDVCKQKEYLLVKFDSAAIQLSILKKLDDFRSISPPFIVHRSLHCSL